MMKKLVYSRSPGDGMFVHIKKGRTDWVGTIRREELESVEISGLNLSVKILEKENLTLIEKIEAIEKEKLDLNSSFHELIEELKTENQ